MEYDEFFAQYKSAHDQGTLSSNPPGGGQRQNTNAREQGQSDR
ncbi:hypothetical protein ACWF0M_30895 [Kribbella sp. NPDC055110]